MAHFLVTTLVLGLLTVGCGTNRVSGPDDPADLLPDAEGPVDGGAEGDEPIGSDVVSNGDATGGDEANVDPGLVLTASIDDHVVIGDELTLIVRIAQPSATAVDVTVTVDDVSARWPLEYQTVSDVAFAGELPARGAAVQMTIPAGATESSRGMATGTAGLAEPLTVRFRAVATGAVAATATTVIAPKPTDWRQITSMLYQSHRLRQDGAVFQGDGCASGATQLQHPDLPPLRLLSSRGQEYLWGVGDAGLTRVRIDSYTPGGPIVSVQTTPLPPGAVVEELVASYGRLLARDRDGSVTRWPGGETVIAASATRFGMPLGLDDVHVVSTADGLLVLDESSQFTYQAGSYARTLLPLAPVIGIVGTQVGTLVVHRNGDVSGIYQTGAAPAGSPWPGDVLIKASVVPNAAAVVQVLGWGQSLWAIYDDGSARQSSSVVETGDFDNLAMTGRSLQFSRPAIQYAGCGGANLCALLVGNTVECH